MEYDSLLGCFTHLLPLLHLTFALFAEPWKCKLLVHLIIRKHDDSIEELCDNAGHFPLRVLPVLGAPSCHPARTNTDILNPILKPDYLSKRLCRSRLGSCQTHSRPHQPRPRSKSRSCRPFLCQSIIHSLLTRHRNSNNHGHIRHVWGMYPLLPLGH